MLSSTAIPARAGSSPLRLVFGSRPGGYHLLRRFLRAHAFDLVTAALAFHWFDRTRFLPEAHRVLRPDGWLVVYNNAFRGVMSENPKFEQWVRDHYLTRYPTPPRDARPLTDAEATTHGFAFVGRETYGTDVSFSVEELVDYLLTQTNVIAAVEKGAYRLLDARRRLLSALPPLFLGPTATFRFGGTIDYLRHADSVSTRSLRSD